MGGPSRSRDPGALETVLEESRRLGFLGPGPIGPHIDHARGFASTQARAPDSFLDLGTGGGLPGLVLALEWPHARGVLLDAMARRAGFLVRACDALGLGDRVHVVTERAEAAARTADLREHFEVVTARSFGPPAVTAECAVGFLQHGGRLVVSEPPEEDGERWPPAGLARLGLEPARPATGGSRYAVFRRSGPLDERYPRRVGVPAKRPLWG